jgi:hypothetical protein
LDRVGRANVRATTFLDPQTHFLADLYLGLARPPPTAIVGRVAWYFKPFKEEVD